MQTNLFHHWLGKLNTNMRCARRHILLLLDNASTHTEPSTPLSNIRIHYFPPNTTAHLQPCDAGLIHSFKASNFNLNFF